MLIGSQSLSKFDVFREFIELGSFSELDSDLRVDLPTVFSLDILHLDCGSRGVSILGKHLSNLGGEGNALSHTFKLEVSMLFEDKFRQEDALVESG